MFIVKKLLAQLISPLPIILFFLLVGLYFLWFSKRQNLGKSVVSLACLLLLLCSTLLFGNLLLRPFESQYRPYSIASVDAAAGTVGKYPVKFIVVLSGGQHPQPGMPLTSFLTHEALVRLIEGIRLHRQHKDSRLVLSGGSGSQSVPEAETMHAIALDLGVREEEIIVEPQSRDTAEQARLIKPIVGDNLFVLVTSASHMPRAMALFAKNNLKPIPAPTGQYVQEMRGIKPGYFIPRYEGVRMAERAVYEFLSTWWQRLTKQI